MNLNLRLDHGGMEEVLKSGEIARQVHEHAATRAASVRGHSKIREHDVTDSVVVEDYVTDRAASAVVIRHPAGLPIQAKYGVLTKGASS